MTNGEKFKEVFKISQVDDCDLNIYVWLPIHDAIEIPLEWWNAEYEEPTTKNDSEHNLCDSCINYKCEFQSGIVRTKCAFYMSSITQQEPRKGHWVIDTHKIRAFGTKYETHNYSVHCDKCNYAWDYTTDKLGSGSLVSNFCPNCGAKMESEEK